jgi:hypothetical protein
MDRRDFYFRQKVTESELDGAFTAAENADFDQFIDAGLSGVAAGLTLAPDSPVSNTQVALTLGTAYNDLGQRIRVSSDITVDLSGVSVVTPGNCVPAGIFVKFDRSLSDPRTDGNGVTVDFQRNESYTVEVVAGAEVVDPGSGNYTESFLNTNGAVITGDNTRIFVGDVIVRNAAGPLDANYILDTRKQWAFKFTSGAYSVGVGTAEESDALILDTFNTFVAGIDTADVSHAPAMVFTPWVNYKASTTAKEALDGIVFDLQATGASVADSGSSCVAYDPANVPAAFSGLATASTVQQGFDQMSMELAGSGGASIVGFTGGGLPAGWGATSTATEVQSALSGIVTDLGTAISGANNGALLIGWMPVGGAVDLGGVTDVALALETLDLNKASIAQPVTWGFAQTFNEIVTINDELDVNAGADPVNIDSNVGISLDAGSASNFTVDGANLILETTTSGSVQVLSAQTVQVQAGATVDVDATTSIDIDTSALTVDASGGATYTSVSSDTSVRSLISGDVNVTAADAVNIMGGGDTGQGVTITNAPSTTNGEATINIVGQDNNSTTINSNGGWVSISGGNYTGTGIAAGQDGGSIELKGGDTSNTGSTAAGGDIFIEPGENTGGGGGPDGEIFFRRQINDGTAATNPAMQFGTGAADISASNPTLTTINFPSAFSSAPRVVNVTFYQNPEGPYHVTNITTTGFDISLNAAAATSTRDFSYIALL